MVDANGLEWTFARRPREGGTPRFSVAIAGPPTRVVLPGMSGFPTRRCLMSRPTCRTDGCSNVARRTSEGKYGKVCETCSRRASGQKDTGARQRKFKQLRGRCACEVCGYRHESAAFFDVHHIDGNHRNDANVNLIVVCPNCHRRAHLDMVEVALGSPRPESHERLFEI